MSLLNKIFGIKKGIEEVTRYLSLILLLAMATNLSANNDYVIKGNGEECRIRYDISGKTILESTCISFYNSKGIKIHCTKNKKICKTQQEVDYAVKEKQYEAEASYGKHLERYHNGLYGFIAQYPADLLLEKYLDAEGKGAWFTDKEYGEVMVKVFGKDTSMKNIKELYRDQISSIEEDINNEITYKDQNNKRFVLSGYHHKDNMIFYKKIYFLDSNNNDNMNTMIGFNITFPIKEKKKYEKLVNIITKNFSLVTDDFKSTVSPRPDTSNLKDLKSILELKEQIHSASFDCTKASTQTEHDICRSDSVSALDLELGNIYLKIKNDMPNESFQNLIQIQREWVKERDRKCSTKSDFTQREQCLIKTYKDRISAFNMISVMDSQIDYSDILFTEVYENGTMGERFELAAYLYREKKNIKQSSKLLRKIIADEQEDLLAAFFALGDMHKEYVKGFPQVSKELLEKNNGSIGMSLIELNAAHDEILNVLIQESYLLNSSSQIMLSIKYEYPIEGQPIYDKRILSFYEECAGEGVPRCEMYLGSIYMNGWGVSKNIDKGIKLLKKSELGDAYLFLAEYYYIQKDIKNCKKYNGKASELGEVKGMHNLGILAQEENKYKDAIKYFEAALKINDKYYPSMMELSKLYIEGLGTEKKYKKAIEMLQIIIDKSNEPGMQEDAIYIQSFAEYKLGLKYLTGKDINITKAIFLIEKAAEQGHPEAKEKLHDLKVNIAITGVHARNMPDYKKACESGDRLMCGLVAIMYERGEDVEKNYAEAKKYYSKECDLNQGYSCGKVGHMYYIGEGGEQDYFEAKKYFTRACSLGEGYSCRMLGNLLYFGQGAKQDYFEAKKHYTKACDLNDGRGCVRLALLYVAGEGVRQDYFKAKKYYGKACDLKENKGCELYKNLNERGY